jgi:hypothetical protein
MIRRSTALVNALAGGFGVKEIFRDCRVFVYSGSQPADADDTATGTHLLTYTLDANTYTQPVKATAAIAIGGTAGALETITIGGSAFNLLSEAVPFTTDAATTTGLIVDNINSRQNPFNITATQSSSTVTLECPYWPADGMNGLTFVTTVSGGLTATTSGVFANGVASANGLNFGESIADGTISKSSENWQAVGVVAGVAGYFRVVAGGYTPDGGSDQIRFDGTAGVSGTDLILSTSSIEKDAVYTMSSAKITEVKE